MKGRKTEETDNAEALRTPSRAEKKCLHLLAAWWYEATGTGRRKFSSPQAIRISNYFNHIEPPKAQALEGQMQ